MITRSILFLIRMYQRYLSLDTGWVGKIGKVLGLRSGISVCIYQPTCSEYMYQAVNRYGIIYGLWLGVCRVARCHPWARGGMDPVPNII